MFETITLAYDLHEDRIFVATDIDLPTARTFWLARRMTLTLLARGAELISQTSPLTAAASAQDRGEVAAIEREAALDATKSALRPTEIGAADPARASAELAVNINVESNEQVVRLTISGARGGQAVGELSRDLFQRWLSLLHEQAAKGDWMTVPAAPSGETGQDRPPALKH